MGHRAASGPPESKLFAKQFERFLINGGIDASAHYFVSCFSATGDDLGQWRAYADNGRGFALGFDTAMLEDGFVKSSALPTGSGQSFRVIYNDNAAIKLQSDIIDKMFHLISLPHRKNLGSKTLHEYMGELLVLTCMHCLRAALFFKHEAYSNEAEYRFLQIHMAGPHAPPIVKYRARPYELVRYREYDWRAAAPSALTKKSLSARLRQNESGTVRQKCLRAYHPAAVVEVIPSLIPYRS